eukprot:3841910-Rhodomonas_salina.2
MSVQIMCDVTLVLVMHLCVKCSVWGIEDAKRRCSLSLASRCTLAIGITTHSCKLLSFLKTLCSLSVHLFNSDPLLEPAFASASGLQV